MLLPGLSADRLGDTPASVVDCEQPRSPPSRGPIADKLVLVLVVVVAAAAFAISAGLCAAVLE